MNILWEKCIGFLSVMPVRSPTMSSSVLLSAGSKSIFKNIFYVCVYVRHVCAGAGKGQERVSDSLKLELQMVLVCVSANTRAY